MQFPGNNSSREIDLGSGVVSSANRSLGSPDMVWDLSNNLNYGFIRHAPKVGLLGLSRLHAANELCKANITPQLVPVHTVVENCRVPDEPGLGYPFFPGSGEVSIAEMARPCYPHGLVTGDGLILRHECLQNQSSNLAGDPWMPARDLPPLPGFETPMKDNTSAPPVVDAPTNKNDCLNEADYRHDCPIIDDHVGPRPQLKVEVSPIFDSEPINAEPLRVYVPEDVLLNGNEFRHPKLKINNNGDRNTLETNSGINFNAVNIAMSGRRYNSCRAHSAQNRKYGPYTCPRCMNVFPTSQSFAAHASAHYRRDGHTTMSDPIISIQNAGKRHTRNNRRTGQRIPYVKPGPYSCSRCHAVLETPHMFATHVSSHYREVVIQGLSGEAPNCPEKKDGPLPNPSIGRGAIYPTVVWLASTLRKVLRQHGKISDKVVPSTPPPGPLSSSSSSTTP